MFQDFPYWEGEVIMRKSGVLLVLVILALVIGFEIGNAEGSGQIIEASRGESSRGPISNTPDSFPAPYGSPRPITAEKLGVAAIAFVSHHAVLKSISFITVLTIFAYLLVKMSPPTYGLVLGGLIFFSCALSLLLLQHYLQIHDLLTETSYAFFRLAFISWLVSICSPFRLNSESKNNRKID